MATSCPASHSCSSCTEQRGVLPKTAAHGSPDGSPANFQQKAPAMNRDDRFLQQKEAQLTLYQAKLHGQSEDQEEDCRE